MVVWHVTKWCDNSENKCNTYQTNISTNQFYLSKLNKSRFIDMHNQFSHSLYALLGYIMFSYNTNKSESDQTEHILIGCIPQTKTKTK